MAVCDGAAIAIRMESVGLCVAFMRGAVVALDFEKEVLQFAERAAVNGGGEFFRRAGELGLPPAKQARNVIRIALNREKSSLGGDGGFQIADTLIRVL